jgi:hypothetical protein
VVTPDKVIVEKPKLKQQGYKLKMSKADKAHKAATARKGLTYSANSADRVEGTLDSNKDKTITLPDNFQGPGKPLFTSEVIVINSADSMDEYESNDPDSDPFIDTDMYPSISTVL